MFRMIYLIDYSSCSTAFANESQTNTGLTKSRSMSVTHESAYTDEDFINISTQVILPPPSLRSFPFLASLLPTSSTPPLLFKSSLSRPVPALSLLQAIY